MSPCRGHRGRGSRPDRADFPGPGTGRLVGCHRCRPLRRPAWRAPPAGRSWAAGRRGHRPAAKRSGSGATSAQSVTSSGPRYLTRTWASFRLLVVVSSPSSAGSSRAGSSRAVTDRSQAVEIHEVRAVVKSTVASGIRPCRPLPAPARAGPAGSCRSRGAGLARPRCRPRSDPVRPRSSDRRRRSTRSGRPAGAAVAARVEHLDPLADGELAIVHDQPLECDGIGLQGGDLDLGRVQLTEEAVHVQPARPDREVVAAGGDVVLRTRRRPSGRRADRSCRPASSRRDTQ